MKKKEIFIYLENVIDAMNHFINSGGYDIPYAEYQGKRKMPTERRKMLLREQGAFFDRVLGAIKIEIVDDLVNIVIKGQSHIFNLRAEEESNDKARKINVESYPNAVDRAVKFCKSFIKQNSDDDVVFFLIKDPWEKGIVSREKEKVRPSYNMARKCLSQQITEKRIKTCPSFNLSRNWPKHPLIEYIREYVISAVDEAKKEVNFEFDSQDLEHQILFRMTAFSPAELFKEGRLLEKHLVKTGVYNDWKKIPLLDSKFISKFSLNKKILKRVKEEQTAILSDRVNSQDFLREESFKNFNKTNIFNEGEGRYILKRNGGKITAFKKDENGSGPGEVPVEFRKIDGKLAERVMSDFHYIHMSRSGGDSFGLFIRGHNFPFAIQIVTFGRNSPTFRKKALLALGFNPDCCLELRRMYTWPGSPLNAISLIDGLIMSYYRNTNKNIEAVITTVMPMYAKTRSTTIASGINQILYTRSLSHKFFARKIKGRIFYEHIIPKNRDWLMRNKDKTIETHRKFPMYPVFGVYKEIQKGSFEKLISNNQIMEFNHK